MKIEMGESLFYSWLRHVKECQIVQTNWKVSAQWNLECAEEIDMLMNVADKHFYDKYGYRIFKQNHSVSQILQQGECDAIGVSIQEDGNQFYAVDVAFHGAGLNYGTKEDTIMKVIAKSIRTAMCLLGYMKTDTADIIFASPKINPAILEGLSPCIEDINSIFKQLGLNFNTRVIANDEFNDSVLKPILLVSEGIADTSELFVRSYQMFTMFAETPYMEKQPRKSYTRVIRPENNIDYKDTSIYKELKIGKLAGVVLRKMLETGAASEDEVRFMQQAEYSKQFFGLNYPLLVRSDSEYEKVRYYAKPLIVYGVEYMLCSQWFEVPANNDRPYLIKWIENHKQE